VPKNPPLTPLAVSPRDAAHLMGVSRSRVYELINAGELPAYKDGARTLILVADIEAWLARLRAMPKSGSRVGPLLPPEERKLARKRVRDSTEPLLAAEPPPPAEVASTQLAPEPAFEPILALESDPEPWVHE
jgi:excisionase family DNA binding protein